MAEWFKAAVLKTADRKVRGFESYSLRQVFSIIIRGFHLWEPLYYRVQTECNNPLYQEVCQGLLF